MENGSESENESGTKSISGGISTGGSKTTGGANIVTGNPISSGDGNGNTHNENGNNGNGNTQDSENGNALNPSGRTFKSVFDNDEAILVAALGGIIGLLIMGGVFFALRKKLRVDPDEEELLSGNGSSYGTQ